jgi:hypothetical protein
MNVEIGTETPIFLFWEYLFRNFGILSLQCTDRDTVNKQTTAEQLVINIIEIFVVLFEEAL